MNTINDKRNLKFCAWYVAKLHYLSPLGTVYAWFMKVYAHTQPSWIDCHKGWSKYWPILCAELSCKILYHLSLDLRIATSLSFITQWLNCNHYAHKRANLDTKPINGANMLGQRAIGNAIQVRCMRIRQLSNTRCVFLFRGNERLKSTVMEILVCQTICKKLVQTDQYYQEI